MFYNTDQDTSSWRTTHLDWVRRRYRDNCSTCPCRTDPGRSRQDTPDTCWWLERGCLWCIWQSSRENTALHAANNVIVIIIRQKLKAHTTLVFWKHFLSYFIWLSYSFVSPFYVNNRILRLYSLYCLCLNVDMIGNYRLKR